MRNTIRAASRLVAELVLTLGLVLLLFAFYLLVWTNHRTAAAQDDLLADFRASTDTASAASTAATDEPRRPDPGDGLAVLHIPRLGADWEWVVLEGTDEDDLRDGPGHFSETAMPGRVGNFAIAGHRATHGEPFAYLDTLAEGDQVVVETGTEWLVYEVTWSRIMTPTSLEVLAPVAGHPGLKARQRTMTLVTCHPRWGSTERLIVGTQLVTRRTADAGPPASIA